jgi:GTP cyclohydrolase II
MDSEKRGTKNAEFLRVSIAIKQLQEIGLSLIERQPELSLKVDGALKYLQERKIKLGHNL